MVEMHKGCDDSTRQEGFLEEMVFEQVFIKASVVLRGENVFQAEGPACVISQPFEDYKWESF